MIKLKESLLLIFVIIFIYLFIHLNSKNVVYVESLNDGKKYMVYNDEKKHDSVELLSELVNRLYKIRKILYERRDEYPEFKEYIELLHKNLHPERTQIYENDINSKYTSYSVNKGEEIVFCLRSKETKKLHTIDMMMYVALHEISHLACPEIGHTPLFKKIFAFIVNRAIELKLYNKIDFESNPEEYCGMQLTSSIV